MGVSLDLFFTSKMKLVEYWACILTLRFIVGYGFVEIIISTNPKPTIYRNLYENTALALDGKLL